MEVFILQLDHTARYCGLCSKNGSKRFYCAKKVNENTDQDTTTRPNVQIKGLVLFGLYG